MELFERIRHDKREEGLSVCSLSRRHNVHRRTVHQALASALPPTWATTARVVPALGAWKPLIRTWLIEDRKAPRKQRHTARWVWERLLDEQGATVAESTVREYVRELRAELGTGGGLASVMIVTCHSAGEEAEVDFGEATIILAGEPTKVHLFHLRLSASGKAVTLAFLSPDQTAFLEGHAIAFSRVGGVVGRIRYDNLTSAVKEVLVGRDRTETDRFIALRSHYGFDAFYCEPGEAGAHEKGGVEGEVGRFRRRHLVPVPKVADMAAFDALLVAADRRDDGRRIAGRAQTVGQAFAAERSALRPLPAEPFIAALPLKAKVDAKARICVRQRWYSVPAHVAGREVPVRLGARHVEVEVFAGGDIVARHERSPRRGTQTLLLDHYLEVLVRKPGAHGPAVLAHARPGAGVGRLHGGPRALLARARRKHGDAAGTRALIEVLLLHRNLPFIAIHAALDTVERMRSADPALVAIEARRIADGRGQTAVTADRAGRPGWARPVPVLGGYDALLTVIAGGRSR